MHSLLENQWGFLWQSTVSTKCKIGETKCTLILFFLFCVSQLPLCITPCTLGLYHKENTKIPILQATLDSSVQCFVVSVEFFSFNLSHLSHREWSWVCNERYMFLFSLTCVYGCISQVAHKLGLLYSEMIFVNGYVHCDPHPGNILVRRNPQSGVEIVFLDHGLYQVCIVRYSC